VAPKVNNLRVVVWGLGQHSLNKILPALVAISGLELYGVCSRNKDVVTSTANKFKCKVWLDPREMLLDDNVDVVYLSTPIGLHFTHGKMILLAGKHLWCEKPLVSRLEDACTLTDMALAKSLQIAEGYMFKYHPHFQQFLQFCKQDYIGSIRSATFRFGIPPLTNPGFRTDPMLGGGAFLDVGCYPIAAALEAFAGASYSLRYSNITMMQGQGVAVDRSGRVVIEFAGGAEVNLEWGINCSYRNEVDIWGESGGIYSEMIFSKPSDYQPYFIISDQNGRKTKVLSVAENHFKRMFEYFQSLTLDITGAADELVKIRERAKLIELIKVASGI
jgi:NDP-hexose-3-ketoreductase